MATFSFKIVTLAALISLVSCEPPVHGQGYNYQRPSYNNYTPRNSYVPPPTAYTSPTNQYLPPTNVGQSDYDQSGYAPTGFNHAVSQTNYNQASYDQSGHDYNQGHDHGHDHGHGHDNEVPKSYEFGYSVKDAQSGNDYNRKESSDGNTVRGEYRVQLPDGRTQIVTYHADWKTGFHADVRYEGEAKYPEPTYNNNNQGSYNYNTPDYSGSLTGFQGNSYKPSSSSYLPPAPYNPPSTSYGTPSYH